MTKSKAKPKRVVKVKPKPKATTRTRTTPTKKATPSQIKMGQYLKDKLAAVVIRQVLTWKEPGLYPWGPVAKRMAMAEQNRGDKVAALTTSLNHRPLTQEMVSSWRVRSIRKREDVWAYSPYEAVKDRSVGNWHMIGLRQRFNSSAIYDFTVKREWESAMEKWNFLEPLPISVKGLETRAEIVQWINESRMRATGRHHVKHNVVLRHLGEYCLDEMSMGDEVKETDVSDSKKKFTLSRATLLYSFRDVKWIRRALLEDTDILGVEEGKKHLRMLIANAINYCAYIIYKTFAIGNRYEIDSDVGGELTMHPTDSKVTSLIVELERTLRLLRIGRYTWQEYLHTLSKDAFWEVLDKEMPRSVEYVSNPNEQMMGIPEPPPRVTRRLMTVEEEAELSREEIRTLKKVMEIAYGERDDMKTD